MKNFCVFKGRIAYLKVSSHRLYVNTNRRSESCAHGVTIFASNRSTCN